jgi:hypothetical protein
MEDLVLNNARMDVRAPTPDLTRAQGVLRARRRILEAAPGWALSQAGMAALRGRAAPSADGPAEFARPHTDANDDGEIDACADDWDFRGVDLADEFATIDALIARSDRVLAGETVVSAEPSDRPFVVRDRDWDEERASPNGAW